MDSNERVARRSLRFLPGAKTLQSGMAFTRPWRVASTTLASCAANKHRLGILTTHATWGGFERAKRSRRRDPFARSGVREAGLAFLECSCKAALLTQSPRPLRITKSSQSEPRDAAAATRAAPVGGGEVASSETLVLGHPLLKSIAPPLRCPRSAASGRRL